MGDLTLIQIILTDPSTSDVFLELISLSHITSTAPSLIKSHTVGTQVLLTFIPCPSQFQVSEYK